jgi:hypothetical protein
MFGTWNVTGGVMQGSGNTWEYSYAYVSSTPAWTDYTVQARFQMPTGAFGGGLGGRLDPATGNHYGVWIYPANSPGGSNALKLVKFNGWSTSFAVMQQVSLSDVGTGSHTLKMTFQGSRILVYYDGTLQVDATDSSSPYLSGGISLDMMTYGSKYTMTVDDVTVTPLQ